MVQAHGVLPDIDDEHLANGQGKQGALPLKVLPKVGHLIKSTRTYLVLGALPAVCALDVKDQEGGVAGPGDPDPVGGLRPAGLVHNVKIGAKQPVQQGA